MSNTLKFGNGEWYGKKDTILAYNDENSNFKPLPFSFDRASSATVVNKDGLIETVGSGEPRIDYKDDSKGALKLEPTRSNLFPYSEDFSNSSWLKVGGAITSNIGVSPDGGLNADRFYIANAVANTRLYISYTFSSSTYTLSVYAKNNGSTDSFRFSYYDGVSQEFSNDFSLTNEWQRFTHTFTAAAGAGAGVVWIATTSSIGVGSELDIQIYGAQLEQGSYATSYIPTQGGAVTRVADVCNNGGNEQVFNDSEGVLYAEISALASVDTNRRRFSISNGGNTERLLLSYSSTTNSIQAFLITNSAVQFDFNYTLSNSTELNKIALKYKANDFALWVNGIEVLTDTNGIVASGLSTLNFNEGGGGEPFYGNIKQIQYFDSALTDAELQALTTI